jgi:hypothetical protein
MNIFKKLRGTIEGFFQLGITSSSNGVANHVNGIVAKTNNNVGLANFVSARADNSYVIYNTSGVNDSNDTTYLDLKERTVLVEFEIDGTNPPSPGDNTGKYGLCTTADPGFNLGFIYHDDGIQLIPIPMYLMQSMCTTIAMLGYAPDSFYICTAYTVGVSASWSIKGDGAQSAVRIDFSDADFTGVAKNIDSAASLPVGAVVIRTILRVDTPFTAGVGAPTISVNLWSGAATVLMATTDNDLSIADQYDIDAAVDVAASSVIRLTTNTVVATAGAGSVFVEYVIPQS